MCFGSCMYKENGMVRCAIRMYNCWGEGAGETHDLLGYNWGLVDTGWVGLGIEYTWHRG